MQTILVALRDPCLRDQVRVALKMFPKVRGLDAPREKVLEILTEHASSIAALVLDYEPIAGGSDPYLVELRAYDPEIPVLAVADRPERQNFNRTKVELDITSFVPLPLDPFDLLRRLHRLMTLLEARSMR